MSFSRYSIEKKQISQDRGVTWSDVDPSETRQGTLVDVYRTLLECEDAACDLEKTEYTIINGALPNEICGNMISILPSGIASSVTWTSGAICCNSWQSATPKSTDRNGVVTEQIIGAPSCTGSYCPSWHYGSSTIGGSEMTNFCFNVHGYHGWSCPATLCACFTIDSFMPWAEGKTSWKLIQAQHYSREHCSEAWETDGEPTIVGIGERWKYVDETFERERWIHQVAKTFDENGNVLTWESEGNFIYRQMTDAVLDHNIEILDYVINDGVLKYNGRPSGGANNTTSTIGVALDENRTSFGGNLFYATDGERNMARYYADTVDPYFHHDIPPSICMSGISGGKGYSGTEGALSNTFKYFKLVDSSKYWKSASMFDGLVGTLSAKITNKYGETLAFPCRIHENLGQENDYWNSSQIGYVRRDGDGSMIAMEYILGYYTNTNGDTKQIKNNFKSLPSLSNAVSVTLSDRVDTIPNSRFVNSTTLTSITMPNVTTVGTNAFSGCTSLSSVTFAQPNTKLYDYAFANSGLRSVDLSNVSRLESEATVNTSRVFFGCRSLSSVTIGDRLTKIARATFSGTSLTNVTIPSNIKWIDYNAFDRCPLTSVTLSEGIETIQSSFQYCTSLESVEIPSTVIRYGAAFMNCSNLKYVTIHSTAEIKDYTFSGCNLTELTITTTTPPSIEDYYYPAWTGVFTFASEAVILVPPSAVDTYKNARNWSVIADMIHPIPNETEWVNIGYACVDGLRYDYEHKRGRNTEYSDEWFYLPEYRTVGEPYGECDGTEPY